MWCEGLKVKGPCGGKNLIMCSSVISDHVHVEFLPTSCRRIVSVALQS